MSVDVLAFPAVALLRAFAFFAPSPDRLVLVLLLLLALALVLALVYVPPTSPHDLPPPLAGASVRHHSNALPMDTGHVTNLAISALAGMAVGVEREWSGHSSGPDARFAGVRTFSLLGFLGGLAGSFLGAGQSGVAVVLLSGAAALVVSAYVMTMRRPGTTMDGTTEAAALVVLALGVVAGLGQLALAGGSTALVVLALMEKSRVQRWLTRVDDHEMRAALQFAVLALVVLPLIPDVTLGPYASVRPRELWIVVLLFSGLNFAGYLARQIVGTERGYGVTGLLGGLVSSTAVTLQFSRKSRTEPQLAAPLGLGVVAACTVLVPRVVIVSALLDHQVGLAVLPFLLPPFVVGAGFVALVLWRGRTRGPDDQRGAPPVGPMAEPERNPLGLWQAIQMALAFQVVLFLMAWVQNTVGTPGVLVSAAVLGLTDMDALTLSMSRLGADAALRQLAATAIGVGLLANTLLKLTLTFALGSRAFQRRASLGLIALGAASVLGLVIGGLLTR